MLEVIIWIQLARALSRTAKSKGRSGGWGALGPVCWLAGEVMGGVVGALLGFETLGIYGLALVFAILGAVVSYVIVKQLPPGAMAPAEQF